VGPLQTGEAPRRLRAFRMASDPTVGRVDAAARDIARTGSLLTAGSALSIGPGSPALILAEHRLTVQRGRDTLCFHSTLFSFYSVRVAASVNNEVNPHVQSRSAR
jgi:hypothetical protein